jgi:hypothetical protein
MDALTTPRGAADRAALEGTLADLGPLELLGLLARTHQTGTLQVIGSTPVLFTLVDGDVSYATDNPARTVRELVRAAAVVEDAAWHVAASDDGRDLGDALVVVGADAEELRQLVHAQILDVTAEVASAPDGRFRFVPGRRHALGANFHYAVAELDTHVRARMAEWDDIRAVVPSGDAIPRLAAALPDGHHSITLTAADWPVLALIDGSRTVKAMRVELDRTLFATSRSLATLVRAGAVTFA